MTTPSPNVQLNEDVLAELKALDPAGELGLLEDIVSTYEEDSAAFLATLSRGVDTGDNDALRRAAHTFKGASHSVGAEQLARCCEDIEVAAHEGRVDQMAAKVQPLPALRDATVAALRIWMRSG